MKNKIITNIAIAIILLVAIGIAYSYVQSKPTPRKSPQKKSLLSVKAYTEDVSDFPITVVYPARVTSQEVVALGVEVGGKIERGNVALKQGETFKKGDLLFSINKDDINAKLKSQKSKLITTLSQALPDIKYDLAGEYDKWQKFFNSISLDDELPPLPEIKDSKEKVYVASKGVLSQYYDIASDEIAHDKHNIYAPFDGVFRSVDKEVGAILSPNAQVGIISSTNRLEVVAGVSLADVVRMNEGDSAVVKARTGEEFRGEITRVSSYVDPKTQMVDVYVNIFDSERRIIEGEMVDIYLSAGILEDVIMIPIDAIAKGNKIYTVSDDNKLYSKDISLVYELGEWAYIKGVNDKTTIVQESIITPSEGMQVNIINEHAI